MHRLVGFDALQSAWASAACALSWVLVLVGTVVVLGRAWRGARRDTALALLIGLLALGLRLVLPWGPLNFVDAERLGPLWLLESWPDPLFASVPTALDGLSALGFEPAVLMRVWGPLFGALGVVATYAASRAFGFSMGAAALAAVVVACFPAHLHYSSGPVLSIEAGTLCIAALALAAAGDIGPLTAPLLAACTTLAVYTRPECRLIVIPVAILTLTSRWQRRTTVLLIGLLVLALAPYVPLILKPGSFASPVPECMKRFGLSLFQNPLVFGLPWLLVAVTGLFLGRLSGRQRWALAAFIAGVTITDAVGGSDPSPQWGQWRYFVVLVPAVALAAAALAERLRATTRPALMVGLFALAAAPVARAWATLRASNDQQATYAFVRETAKDVVQEDGTVYVLRSADTAAPQSAALLGLAAVFGPFEGVQWGCRFDLPPNPAVRVRVVDPETMQCRDWIRPSGSVLFLGPDQSEDLLSLLRRDYELIPLTERSLRVVMDMPDLNASTCSAAGGLRGPTDEAHLGWYRLSRRAPTP